MTCYVCEKASLVHFSDFVKQELFRIIMLDTNNHKTQ